MDVVLPAVLVIIGIFQIWYIRSSLKAKSNLSNAKITEGEIEHILSDVDLRARRGELIDFMAYQDRLDRLMDPELEKIRQFAGAALATGIGGTMFMFAVDLSFLHDPPLFSLGADPERLADRVLPAIISSVWGIAVHLYLVLIVLQSAQGILDKAITRVSREVRERFQSLESPLSSGFGESFQKELTQAFSEALNRLPEVFQRVHLDAQDLIKLAGNQLSAVSDKMDKAANVYEDLMSVARTLVDSAQKVDSTTDGIAESIQRLNEMPGRIEESLGQAATVWKSEIGDVQDGFLKAVQHTLAEQRTAFDGIKEHAETQITSMQHVLTEADSRQKEVIDRFDQLSELLKQLPEETRKAQENMHQDFGEAARNHVHDLKNSLNDATQNMHTAIQTGFTEMNQIFVHNVTERFDKLSNILKNMPEEHRQVLEGMDQKLGKEAANHVYELKEAVNQGTSGLQKTLENALQEMKRNFISDNQKIIGDIFDRLRTEIDDTIKEPLTKVGDNISKASTAMPAAAESFAENLKASAESMQDIPERLNTAAEGLEDTMKNMQWSLQSITDNLQRIATTRRPVRVYTQRFYEKIQSTLDGLVRRIKKMFGRD